MQGDKSAADGPHVVPESIWCCRTWCSVKIHSEAEVWQPDVPSRPSPHSVLHHGVGGMAESGRGDISKHPDSPPCWKEGAADR